MPHLSFVSCRLQRKSTEIKCLRAQTRQNEFLYVITCSKCGNLKYSRTRDYESISLTHSNRLHNREHQHNSGDSQNHQRAHVACTLTVWYVATSTCLVWALSVFDCSANQPKSQRSSCTNTPGWFYHRLRSITFNSIAVECHSNSGKQNQPSSTQVMWDKFISTES